MGAKNCPETPRQQMIGMMYLVLTAMLALNVSKDILQAFNVVDDTLAISTKNLKTAVDARYDGLYAINEQSDNWNESVQLAQEEAKKLKKMTNDMVTYIETLRWDLTKECEGNSDDVKEAEANAKGKVPFLPVGKMEAKDNFDKPTTFMLGTAKDDGTDPNCKANELKNKLDEYKKNLEALINNPLYGEDKIANVKKDLKCLETNDAENAGTGKTETWAYNTFFHMIQGGAAVVFSKLVNDVKAAEASVLDCIMSSVGTVEMSFGSYTGRSLAKSHVLFAGETYETQLVVAALDPEQELEVHYKVGVDSLAETDPGTVLNGNATGVELSIPNNGVGEHKVAGYIIAKNKKTGKKEYYHFNDTYQVVNKGAVTISADKMNVLYAGIANPVTGAGGSNLSVSFPGCSVASAGGSGKYNVTPPASMVGQTITATVSADKESSSMSFRVKKVPDPYSMAGGVYGGKKSPSELNANPFVVAKTSEDFVFDLKWKVVSFTAEVIEKDMLESYPCTGGAFSQNLKDRIAKSKKNTVISFTNIKARCEAYPSLGDRTLRDVTIKIK